MASTEPRTLLLFCPFDKKVTRHTRRGPKMQLICVDCGRGMEPDSEGPSVVKAPSAQRDRAMGSPREVPDLAQILAGSAELPVPRPRRSGAPRSGAEAAPVVAPAETPRRSTRRGGPRSKLHAVWIIGAAFFAALALANVVGNLLGGQRADPAAEPEVAVVAGRIANTDGQGVYIRRSVNLEDRLATAIPEGAPIRVIGPERIAQGTGWRQVEESGGIRGWVPAQYVVVDSGA